MLALEFSSRRTSTSPVVSLSIWSNLPGVTVPIPINLSVLSKCNTDVPSWAASAKSNPEALGCNVTGELAPAAILKVSVPWYWKLVRPELASKLTDTRRIYLFF